MLHFLDQTFDAVDRARLLDKMHHLFRKRDVANQPISYLSDKNQYKKIVKHKSKKAKITLRIPQLHP